MEKQEMQMIANYEKDLWEKFVLTARAIGKEDFRTKEARCRWVSVYRLANQLGVELLPHIKFKE